MAIQDDFTVAQNGNIRYVGAAHGAAGAGYYTVIAFHRWLGGLSDDAVASAASSDFLDMTDSTPSERSTDNIITLLNGYNIDQTASEHLYDGSIIQAGGDDIWDGIVIFATKGMDLQVVQNGAVISNDFWNTIPNGDTYKGLNRDTNNGISHRFMIKVRTAGSDIDGKKLLGQTRDWGKTFSEFKINGTSRGNNVMALTYADDLNNTTSVGSLTSAPFSGVSNLTQGYNGMDVDANTVNEYYYSKWDKGSCTINQFYERMKYLTMTGTSATLYGLNGELFRGITHEITVDTPSVTDFSAYEAVSWSGGTGQMLAINDVNAPTKMWIQLITGSAPTDNQVITGGTSGATCQVNVTVTERSLSFPFCGVSTGSALIGAYGFGVEALDLAYTDKVFDLTNTQVSPQDNRTFTVSGLVSGEDYIIVGPYSGSTLMTNQFLLNTALTTNNITSVIIKISASGENVATIPSNTPSTGYIRVADNNGVYRRLHYSSWTGSTFTIDTVDGNEDFGSVNASADNEVYISYIDELASSTSASYTAPYNTGSPNPRNLFVRVRDGGGTPIKTYETNATWPGSATAIRTSDA